MFKNIEAVIFDFDGTLVELNMDFNKMKEEVFKVLSRYTDKFPKEKLYIIETINYVCRNLDSGENIKREALNAMEKIELKSAKSAKPINGVMKLLKELKKRKIKIGIVTRNCKNAVKKVISKFNFPYNILLTRDDVKRVKPHPLHLKITLEYLNCKSSRSIMVGDHPLDIIAGKKAGMKTVGVLSSGKTIDDFAYVKPDIVLNIAPELIKYIENEFFYHNL